ncbi:MAG: hypothetical protein GWM90_23100, partial [Gemmatimonadetes bacterium]|nr:hypothetical protein [Gemmatimonadota bacterium]NIQ57541.1 hypothetical protein [Gemmatimonadota bacterium]NIU77703.1 hypothetical protein [Gammaproteobacteria bacterium]NIX46861.1 hypothetical protein [Gemmatimonadota bacterium]NIY11207.1 hypothetical protein [Gemmatimonadota bacterium]
MTTLHRGALAATLTLAVTACASTPDMVPLQTVDVAPLATAPAAVPDPDPRVGLEAGVYDAGEAIWNLRLLSSTPAPEPFIGVTNSDLAFTGDYAIQGNYNGFQVWDISDPEHP